MRLVYLSPVPWASFAQRPHKFVEWFHHRTDGSVLWIDPYPTRLPTLKDLRRCSPRKGMAQGETPGWLTVVRPRALPIEPLPALGKANRLFWDKAIETVSAFASQGECLVGIGKPSELALQVLARVPHTLAFYDAMDDFPAFYSGLSRIAMARREAELAARVDKMMVSSGELQLRFRHHQQKISLAPNACAIDSLPPVEALSACPPKLVLGYIGTVGPWFDWPLVISLARQNPAATLRIIGPVHARPSGLLPQNVELFPTCSHAEAIKAMMEFSAGLIPFKKNALTASVDPIKYYEYRALGLPVISTSFGEMAKRHNEPTVFYMDDTTDLGQVVTAALALKADRREIESFRAENCWEARFDATAILDKFES